MIDKLLSFVAPHPCSGCQKPGSLLCSDCKYDIVSEPFGGCVVCGEVSEAGICRRHGVSYETAWCVGERGGALQRLVGTYKFQNTRAAFWILANLLDERLPSFDDKVVIVPVPTVTAHVRERGYDHVGLIARRLAKLRGASVENLVARATKTIQRHAPKEVRKTQADRAFGLRAGVSPDKTYLILDDVITTGATVEAIARLLRRAGARRAWVAAVARQPLD